MRFAQVLRRNGDRAQRGERGGKRAERLDPRVRSGPFLVRPEAPIDPDRANARGPRARDIASQRVADHDRLWGARADAVERDLEDARVGFRETDLARDDNRAEVARQRRARELLTLDVGCSVGHEREPMIQSEPREHRLGLRIDRLSRAPDRPVRLDELVRERTAANVASSSMTSVLSRSKRIAGLAMALATAGCSEHRLQGRDDPVVLRGGADRDAEAALAAGPARDVADENALREEAPVRLG